MKDAVIFHPARTTGESAEAAVEMEQSEMAAEYAESAHPYKQPAEVLHIADETKNRTGYVLFPKVTKFNTWLLSRYGKQIEVELVERIMAGEYAATMGLNGDDAVHISWKSWEDGTENNRRMLEVRNAAYQASLDFAVLLRTCTGGTWASYRLFHAGMATPIPLVNGGTGASSAKAALSNLGIFYSASLPSSGTDGQICLVPV